MRWVPWAALALAIAVGGGAAGPAARAAEGSGTAGAKSPAAAEVINLYEDNDKASPAGGERKAPAKTSPLSLAARTGFWLGAVIALICGLVALAKKVLPRSAGWGRSPAAEVVARAPLEAKRSVYLLKIGSRVFLVGSAENGLSSLGEISDREEVEHLVCLARGKASRPGRASSEFTRVLGGKLSRLAGLVGLGGQQVTRDEEELRDEVGGPSDVEEMVGCGRPARAAHGGVEALKEQLERLKRIS